MAPALSEEYLAHVAHSESLRAELLTLAGQDGPQAMSKRVALATELLALELHLLRELSEAVGLGLGPRES